MWVDIYFLTLDAYPKNICVSISNLSLSKNSEKLRQISIHIQIWHWLNTKQKHPIIFVT